MLITFFSSKIENETVDGKNKQTTPMGKDDVCVSTVQLKSHSYKSYGKKLQPTFFKSGYMYFPSASTNTTILRLFVSIFQQLLVQCESFLFQVNKSKMLFLDLLENFYYHILFTKHWTCIQSTLYRHSCSAMWHIGVQLYGPFILGSYLLWILD